MGCSGIMVCYVLRGTEVVFWHSVLQLGFEGQTGLQGCWLACAVRPSVRKSPCWKGVHLSGIV